MASNPTGFKIHCGIEYPATAGTYYDLDDIYLRKDLFQKGGLWIWGSGAGGQLGNDLTTSRSSPIQTCISGNRWRKVCVSKHDGHFALALTSTGQVWAWGCNDAGQVSSSPSADCLCPVLRSAFNIKLISAGGAVATTYSSGFNAAETSQYGVGSLTTGEVSRSAWGCAEGDRQGDKTTPVLWADLSMGNRFGIGIADSNTASILDQCTLVTVPGRLVEWGAGRPSGTGYTVSNTPYEISCESWRSISAGNSHALAIKCDGTLWAWGCNAKGQLGTGDTINRSLLVQVGSSNNWTAITAGCNFSAAILAGPFRSCAAVIYTWGENASGQLGDNTTIDRSSPTQIASGCTNWKKISGGDSHFAAVQTDGTLWLWGSNQFGELGRNDRISRSSPVQVQGGTCGWYEISAGQCATSALRDSNW